MSESVMSSGNMGAKARCTTSGAMPERRSSARRLRRGRRGSFIAEVGPTLWVLFVLFTIPFLNLTTIAIRYTFLVSASRDAAYVAALAKSFWTNVSAQQLSAVNLAQNQATQTAGAFTGITMTGVTTRIVITNLNTRVVTRQTAPLAAPADTATNLYQIETVVNANVDPLIPFVLPFLGSVPGLSGPMAVQVTSRELCEYPQGLNS